MTLHENKPELCKIKRGNERENKEKNDESKAYFYKMDIHRILSLFTYGIPGYIIPAVPCHAVAYILTDFLKFHNQELSTDEVKKEKSSVKELFIRPKNFQLQSFFEDIVSSFPEDVMVGCYPERGMLFFSYAKEGEIYPDGYPGPTGARPLGGENQKQLRNMQDFTSSDLLSICFKTEAIFISVLWAVCFQVVQAEAWY